MRKLHVLAALTLAPFAALAACSDDTPPSSPGNSAWPPAYECPTGHCEPAPDDGQPR